MNRNFFWSSAIFFIFAGINAGAEESLSITARRESGRLDFEVINKGKSLFFIGDVDKCGASLQVISASIKGGIPVLLKKPSPAWKHLVALTPKNDETSKTLWTYSFSIKSNELPKDKISAITLGIWIASESDFKNTTIESLQLKKFKVELVD